MPVSPTYPGVYIEEIPSGIRTIAGVKTSVAAFIGTFSRGLLNEAVRVQSLSDFEREFGGLDRMSDASYAIEQFFLNGGGEAWIVRIGQSEDNAADGPTPEALRVPTQAATRFLPATVGGAAGSAVLDVTAGRQIRGETAQNPGNWGNSLRMEIAEDGTAGETFTLTVKEIRIDGEVTTVVQQETYRNLTLVPNVANNALDVVNTSSLLIQLALGPGAPTPPVAATRPHVTGTLGTPLDPNTDFGTSLPTVADISDISVDLQDGSGASLITGGVAVALDFTDAADPGSMTAWAALLQTRLRRTAQDPSVELALRPYLAGASVTLIGDGTAAAPWRFHVRAGQGARPFDPEVTLVFTEPEIPPATGATANHLDASVDPNVVEGPQQLVFDGGQDGTIVTPSGAYAITPQEFTGNPLTRTGLYALDDIDLFNILAFPDAPRMDASAAFSSFAVYSEALTYVIERRAMLIIDIPDTVRRIDQMEAWFADNGGALGAPNSVVMYPRVVVPDALMQNRPKSLPASGSVAGIWARTDGARGVWKAPAGTEARLRGVADLTFVMTDQQNGILNPLGVNCLRSFPIYGPVVWGARTLDGPTSEWLYVPVRRLTLFIEESLYRGTQWVVFEPNDEPLWAQVRLNVTAFMQNLFLQGAFQGPMPDDAYRVKCDAETTTQADIDAGILNINIAFAPVKPAEFVILKIQQLARRASV